ncbi:MAG: hypothetical protein KDD73_13300 [Anaerolineales bacterium]|nr:hypothetical protein [Anaerolineales bacterium]MCB9128890.1 hypothetical protein [Ardenticatenales bacterium]
MSDTTTPASLRALMHGLIDYAGLFPPAELTMQHAIDNYLRYRQEPEAWMLGRFIVPASRLDALSAALPTQLSDADPLPLAVLPGRGDSRDLFLSHIEVAASQIATFQQRHGRAVRVDVIEATLPDDGLLDTLNLKDDQRLMAAVDQRLAPIGDPMIFYEVPPNAHWAERVALTVEAIAAHNHAVGRRAVGFKLRCGRTPNPAFPFPEQVAFAIDVAHAANVPLKATAGLHHPVRAFNEEEGHIQHGFFNLFFAGLLDWSNNLPMNILTQIMLEQDNAAFTFTDDAMQWRNLRATTEQIADLRQRALISYGSCSFTEPREDLQSLGYL